MNTQKFSRCSDYFQYDLYGEVYVNGAEKVGKYYFPRLSSQNHIPIGEVRPFNYLLSLKHPEKYWIHCFCDDYQFERLWRNLNYYIGILKKTKGFISTDFSLYRDFSEDRLIWNCYRNRCISYALEKASINLIPTAGFGVESTWDWCFDGLPHDSSVAITTNGILSDPEAKRIFVGGVDAMVRKIHPRAIIVCGKYPTWLNTKYPNIQIVSIPSYSQQWKERCA